MLLSLLLAALASSVVRAENDLVKAPTPVVSLLTDSPSFHLISNITIRSILATINNSSMKDSTFYFGSSIADLSLYPEAAAWTDARFQDTWSLGVAENNCKMEVTQPGAAYNFSLDPCKSLRDYVQARGAAFRGHAGLWHSQRPPWILKSAVSTSVAEINDTIIPRSVKGVIEGLGPDVLSWDVVNEPWSDTGFPGMNETFCVVNATRWPNFAVTGNASSPVLFRDSSWISTAFRAAASARETLGSSMKLFLNDYNVGGTWPSQPKTDCALLTIAKMQSEGVPIDGLGIQSHYSANHEAFPSKESAHWTFDRLKNMGLEGAITEMDVWLSDDSTESVRWQASIFGDILDACLYSSNCNEFLVWNSRDDQSWLNTFPDRGISQGTLFDKKSKPKLAYYEVLARLYNFAQGRAEPCATSSGVESCVLTF